MSEAFTRATRPGSIDDVADACWTDCDLDPCRSKNSQALARLGITRAVFGQLPHTTVTLSPEATPHDLATRFVIPAPRHPDSAMIRDLHAQGVRGVRFVLADDADRARGQLDKILRYADRIADSDWHIELGLGSGDASLSDCEWTLMRFPVALCISGLAGFVRHRAADDAELQFLLALLQMGRTWIKLSGAVSEPLASLGTFVRTAVVARRDRIVWGSGALSDPMHATANASDGMADVAAALATLKAWIADDNDRETILTANPSQLYGFAGLDP